MTATGVRERPVGSSRPPAEPRGRMSRDAFENRFFGIARWVVIVVLLVLTLFPFWYMLILSVRSLDSVLQDPGALWVSFGEVDLSTYTSVLTPTADGGQGFLVFM